MRSSIVFLSLLVTRALAAQETERPVSFDQAGRLATLSASLATRLALSPPTWPVIGAYVDARLYERQNGDFVIAVQKADGTIDRYPISASARRELADGLVRGMIATGLATSAERFDIISEPAGNRFVLSQVAAGFLIYGPAAAQVTEGSGAAVLYLLTAGGTFFVSSAIANSRTVTKAQNSLATDGIWRGALIANALRYAARGAEEPDVLDPYDPNFGYSEPDRVTPLVTFAGAMAGTIIGFNMGRTLTDAEAAGAALGSTVTAATTAGLLGVANAYSASEDRLEIAAVAGAALAGYPLGLRYVRRARYRVTAGDASTVLTTGAVGAIFSGVFMPTESRRGSQLAAGLLTGGFLSGLMTGDRLLAKPYDLTESQAMLVRVGAVAGGLIGFAIPIAFEMSNERAVMGFGSLGAILGMAATTGIIKPARAKP